MSSMRNKNKAINREHRERPQIKEREELGFLEKKKDWIKRARDFQEKRDKIQELRESTLSKNQDEFYHHMIRSQVGKDGVHRDLNMSEILGEDEGGIDKDLAKDLHYVTYKYVNEKKKIEKLKSSLQLAFVSQGINKRIIYQDNSDDEEIKGVVVKGTSNLPSDTMINAETKKNYKLLAERIKKLKDLEVVKQKLELQLNMRKAKKDKVKATIVKKGTPTRAAVVRFPVIRKK